MDNDIVHPNNPRNGKALAGMFLLIVGGVMLLEQFDFFPDRIALWPLWIMGFGLYLGFKNNFRKPSAMTLIIVGSILLLVNNLHGASGVIWPAGIIAFGIWMIVRRNNRFDPNINAQQDNKWDWKTGTGTPPADPIVDYTIDPEAGPKATHFSPSGSYKPTGDDYLDTVSVFGSVKKTILSKNFKGGEIVNIFGGAELDFTQADINGKVIIDITQIFGGVKMIVPPHWQVVPDIAAVFAGIEDKRLKSTASVGSDKILILKGVSIFAGVDIRSY
ncbi:cell wall-active antibiotics response protein [Mucilaginibacter sp. BJC16-A38]|uniref:cell wall-active antibiotics response protein n=1 Tax=Mucilaginibacter phenanthrenivorans TaxID=1234842 RepID=UPI0021576D78|nr:cell wall-active antibiotics response protein [Mucilaginibacter phenanthrenivorans]MCR8558285.1 cell wall-active antibiotics response protein [Mucilaginibacter phenanthrenivorans]